MRKIQKPNFDPKAVYLACVSRIRNGQLRTRLQAIVGDVEIAADDYDSKAENNSLYLIPQYDNIGGSVTKQEMEEVYTLRMAKKGRAGRKYYDKLKASAKYGVCPLCGHRQVSQLDHYLPKANFPLLAVLPFNLVPSCSDCNKAKLTKIPTDAESQTLHPYYDDIANKQWLYAEIIETSPAAVRFFVETSTMPRNVTEDRIKHHFTTLELDDLYRSQAAVELSNIRGQLSKLFDSGGEDRVRKFLSECVESRAKVQLNSWQTAFYQAIAESDWFCKGGFREI